MIRYLLKGLRRAIGVAMLVFVVFMLLAIVSFHPDDPTILNANDNKVQNWVGETGADLADCILQSVGYVVVYPLVFLIILSARMILVGVPKYLLIRASLLLLVMPVVCGTVDLMARYLNADSRYIGGFIGDYVVIELATFIPKRMLLSVLFAVSFVGILLSIGLRLQEWWIIFKAVANATAYTCSVIFKTLLRRSKNLEPQAEPVDVQPIIRPRIRSAAHKDITTEALITIKPVAVQNLKIDGDNNQQSLGSQSHVSLQGARFMLPSTKLLQSLPPHNKASISKDVIEQNATALNGVLQDFGITAEMLEINPGPVVTLYEFEPAAGTKSARVIGLADDIARSMKAVSARIAVIPGKNAIGIELPNQKRETVYLREMLESMAYNESQAQLPLILGKNIGGNPVVADLSKMPHVLVAGTTGSGKSVAINTMILSLLYRHTPDTCKFVMIDPKMLELSVYDGIPHLLSPVVTDPKKAVMALKWVVQEMEERYRLMSTLGVRNISGYNKAVLEAIASGKLLTKNVQTGFDKGTGKPIFERIAIDSKELPYIVVIVDEMADLMLVAGKDIEAYIQRLAQMARAAGIHIIMATQRPSVDVITGVIKANFPTRISFQVTSKIDSRTVLGEQGAEQLLGMGDMLYMMPGGKIERVHGPFVDDIEVEHVVRFWKEQGEPEYVEDITASEDSEYNADSSNEADDDLYKQAVEVVIRDRKASTSYIQRCFRIGYNRAATIIERMEKEGVVSTPNHVGKREILL